MSVMVELVVWLAVKGIFTVGNQRLKTAVGIQIRILWKSGRGDQRGLPRRRVRAKDRCGRKISIGGGELNISMKGSAPYRRRRGREPFSNDGRYVPNLL